MSWGSGLFVAALKEGLPLSEFNSQLEPFICAAAPDLAPQMAALAQAATTDGPMAAYGELLLKLLESPLANEGLRDTLWQWLTAEELALVEASARYSNS